MATGHPSLILAVILCAGVLAFWLAEKLDLPDVLVGLGFGHLLRWPLQDTHTVEVLRVAMLQVVGVSVAVLFFEGGRVLGRTPLGAQAGLVRHLAALGPKLGWVLGSLAAWLTMGVSTENALLVGAVLMVTAPYLSDALVTHLRGASRLGLVLHWETFLVTCVGLAWTVMVAGALVAHSGHPSMAATLKATALTALVGLAVGSSGGLVLFHLFRHRVVSRRLEDPAALAILMLAFGGAQAIHWGAGLLAAIVVGYGCSRVSQPEPDQKDFWLSARVISLALLAVCMGILISPTSLVSAGFRGLALAALMVGVVRPLLVLLGARKSGLSRAEMVVLMLGAPRGVLTLATAALIQVKLQERGITTEHLIGSVYWVVLLSILVPWTLGPWLVRRAQAGPETSQS